MTAGELAAGLGIGIKTVYTYSCTQPADPDDTADKSRAPDGFPRAHRFGRTLYYLREDFETYRAANAPRIEANLRRVARAAARRAADTAA